MILCYDGSLSGFLCLIGRAIKERIEVTAIISSQQSSTADLFNNELQIETDRDWAAKIAGGVERKLGKGFMTTFAQALLSEEEGVELDLLHLTRRALHEGRHIMAQLADPLVNRIDSAALRTGRERHRLLGLLRFSRLADDSYLARIIPRTNVVPLLGSHFAKRLGDQRWLIVDDKRKVGVWGKNRRWEVVEDIEIAIDLTEHASEQQVADLWRSFYGQISNPARYNPKLRRQFMPKIYWQYLTEMRGR
jgi:probable DNA metabolism protein